MADIATFEDQVLDLVRRYVSQYVDHLASIGLTPDGPRLKRSGPQGPSYCSEITVFFSDDKGIFDAIEFQVFRKNTRLASTHDIETWLVKTLDDVIQRRRSHLKTK